MAIDDCCTRITARLTPLTAPLERLAVAAGEVAGFFGVTAEDIAIFSCDSARQALILRWPASLRSVGSIPMNAANCLVARTVREGEAFCDNAFTSTPHLYLFEHFLSPKEERIPIQKIISAPVVLDNELCGALQVARKGVNRDAAGNDFSDADLAHLLRLATTLAPFI